MGEEKFILKQEYIQLNQLLKLLGWVESGSEANAVIDEGLVSVNGQIETRRRNKIYSGFTVDFNNNKVIIGHGHST